MCTKGSLTNAKLVPGISRCKDRLPPVNWSMEQKQEYLLWAQQVVSGLRGINPALEKTFDDLLEYALNKADAAGAGPLPGE